MEASTSIGKKNNDPSEQADGERRRRVPTAEALPTLTLSRRGLATSALAVGMRRNFIQKKIRTDLAALVEVGGDVRERTAGVGVELLLALRYRYCAWTCMPAFRAELRFIRWKRRSISALSRHRRRHVNRAVTLTPALKIDRLAEAIILSTGTCIPAQ